MVVSLTIKYIIFTTRSIALSSRAVMISALNLIPESFWEFWQFWFLDPSFDDPDPSWTLTHLYRARAQDALQEMERKISSTWVQFIKGCPSKRPTNFNELDSELMAWIGFAWMLFRFSPYSVGHPAHEHGRYVIPVDSFHEIRLMGPPQLVSEGWV